jgi:hypothetical protein
MREAGHDGAHMSRTWDASLCTEIIDEWQDIDPWTCASCGRTFVGSPGDPGTSRDAVRCPVRSGSVQCVPCDPHP